jgi:hypothetical protein
MMKTRCLVPAVWLSLFCLVLWGCKGPLPKPTQEGKNTLGCRLDGKKWIPNGLPGAPGGGRSAPVLGGYQKPIAGIKWFVHIQSYRDQEGVILFLRDVVKPGVYELNQATETFPRALTPSNYALYETRSEAYLTDATHTGQVTITRADTVNWIISGTFEFTAVNRQDPGKVVRVTKGRFDVTNKP